MITKIIQIADLHIPNNEEKRPYNEILMSFLKQLYKNEIEGTDADSTRIVICGDIFENKIRTTNEARMTFHTLLNYCNEFCPTIIIAGNHDMLENNHDRVDSLAPTFEIEGVYDNVHYLDKELNYKSGYVEDDNVIWNLFSMHDNFAPTNLEHSQYPDKKIIGLYHGEIVGAMTDTGKLSDCGLNTDTFKECDCVMAGHIHRHQEIKKNGVPIVYASSLFQHDAGENTTGHGYCVWNINDMTYRHIDFDCTHKIYKFKIKDYDDISNDKEDLINF